MSDVKDILGIAHTPVVPQGLTFNGLGLPDLPGGRKEKKTSVRKKKKSAIKGALKREVQALQDSWSRDGETMAPAVPVKQVFAAKRKTAAKWLYEQIMSPARREITNKEKDDLTLMHWVKVPNMEYRFAKFNKHVKILKYSDLEYEYYLQDPYWTREETDELIDLCDRFDLRFLVIHDQFLQWQVLKRAEENEAKIKAEMPALVKTEPGLGSNAMDTSGSSNNNNSSSGATNNSNSSNSNAMQIDSLSSPTPNASSSALETKASDSAATTPVPDTKVKRRGGRRKAQTPGSGSAREKTVEDLKARYYMIQQALLSVRNASDSEMRKNPLYKNSFDADYETERKAQLNKLFQRSQGETQEMSTIVLEHHKVQQAIRVIKKTAREKGIVLKQRRAEPAAPQQNSDAQKPLKKRRINPPSHGGEVKSSYSSGNLAEIPADCFAPPIPKEKNSGVYIRSNHIHSTPPNLKSFVSKFYETELTNLGFRRSFACNNTVVSNQMDKLKQDIITWCNLQRYVKKKEEDMRSGKSQSNSSSLRLSGHMQMPGDGSAADGMSLG